MTNCAIWIGHIARQRSQGVSGFFAGDRSQNGGLNLPKLPQGMPLIRVMAMPADANPNGDIFGGWLLSQMDLAGGSLAAQRAKGRCATVAVDGMVFHEPVFVGDEVSCYGELVKTGRTSMTVRVEAWRRHLPSDEVRKVTEATFTYVAIGEDRRPRPLPPATRS
jgi:acyl-CoA thioesterase YciA